MDDEWGSKRWLLLLPSHYYLVLCNVTNHLNGRSLSHFGYLDLPCSLLAPPTVHVDDDGKDIQWKITYHDFSRGCCVMCVPEEVK